MSTLLTIITTAITTYAFTLAMPYVKGKWNAFRDNKKRKKTPDRDWETMLTFCSYLVNSCVNISN